jgi:hypothetical protein
MAESPEARLDQARETILRTLAGTSMLGARLMKLSGVHDPELFLRAVTSLIDEDVVQVTGDLTPDRVPFAAFGTRPSDRGYIQRRISKK